MARPPQAMITRENAARAALAEVDSNGLDGFGLGRVATRLGVKAPSFYHHFDNKDELLAETARLLLVEGRIPFPREGLDWREEIVRISCASRRAVLLHPKAAPLLLRFFPRQILLGAYERWTKIFALNGVPLEWRVILLEGAEKMTFGSALYAAAAQTEQIEAFPHADPGRFPFLEEARAANDMDEEAIFIASLRAFLDGLPLDQSPFEYARHKPNDV